MKGLCDIGDAGEGAYCLPNIFMKDNKVSGYIDLGRGGLADKYQDIALCYRSLLHNYS